MNKNQSGDYLWVIVIGAFLFLSLQSNGGDQESDDLKDDRPSATAEIAKDTMRNYALSVANVYDEEAQKLAKDPSRAEGESPQAIIENGKSAKDKLSEKLRSHMSEGKLTPEKLREAAEGFRSAVE